MRKGFRRPNHIGEWERIYLRHFFTVQDNRVFLPFTLFFLHVNLCRLQGVFWPCHSIKTIESCETDNGHLSDAPRNSTITIYLRSSHHPLRKMVRIHDMLFAQGL